MFFPFFLRLFVSAFRFFQLTGLPRQIFARLLQTPHLRQRSLGRPGAFYPAFDLGHPPGVGLYYPPPVFQTAPLLPELGRFGQLLDFFFQLFDLAGQPFALLRQLF